MKISINKLKTNNNINSIYFAYLVPPNLFRNNCISNFKKAIFEF